LARPEHEPKTPLASRLRAVRSRVGDPDRDEFALKIGVSKNTLAHYERGDRTPDAEVLAAYRSRVKVNINWLTTGDGEMFDDTGEAHQRVPALLNDNVVTIPQFEIQAAAGPGMLAGHEAPVSWMTVDRDWLRRFLPVWAGSNARLGILQGAGDSMSPTIEDGDLIMVAGDPPDWVIAQGGVFVVLHHDHLRIKRINIVASTGDVQLISDNGRYGVETIARDRVEFDLSILGQVFFSGGRLRG